MKLSQREVDHLYRLYLEHRQGAITDSDYELQSDLILKGRPFPDFSSAQFDSVEETKLPPIKSGSETDIPLDLLTTCNTESRNARRKGIEDHISNLQESVHAKEVKKQHYAKQGTALISDKVALDQHIPTDAPPSSLLSGSYQAVPNALSTKRKSNTVPMTIILVAATLSTVATLYLVSREKPIPAEEQVVTFDTPSISSKAELEHYFYNPLFGPLAERQCQDECNYADQSTQVVCARSCSRLSLSLYGRRIALTDPDPVSDAKAAARSCKIADDIGLPTRSDEEWMSSARGILASLSANPSARPQGSVGNTRVLYESLKNMVNDLPMSAESDSQEIELAYLLRSAACLRANLALSELAILLSKQSNDTISEKFFTEFYQALKPIATSFEKQVMLRSDILDPEEVS